MKEDGRSFFKRIKSYGAFIDEDTFLAFHEDYPCLCSIDLSTHTAHVDKWLPDADGKLYRLFYSFVIAGDKAVMIPGESGRIDIVELNTERIKSIKLDFDAVEGLSGVNSKDPFFKGFSYKNYVYILGATYPGIVKLNLETDEIDKHILLNVDSSKKYIFGNGYVIRDTYALLPIGAMPAIGKFNLETDELEIKKLKPEIRLVHGILEYRGEILLLISDDKNRLLFCKFDENDGLEELLCVDDKGSADGEDTLYWEPVEAGDDIFVFSMNKAKAYRVDLKNSIAYECKTIIDGIENMPDKNARFMIALLGKRNNNLLFQTLWDRRWYEYDPVNDKLDSYYVNINDDEYIRRWWKHHLSQNGILHESICSLEYFIKTI